MLLVSEDSRRMENRQGMQTQLYYYPVILCVAKIVYDSCSGKYIISWKPKDKKRTFIRRTTLSPRKPIYFLIKTKEGPAWPITKTQNKRCQKRRKAHQFPVLTAWVPPIIWSFSTCQFLAEQGALVTL